jgi:hypothetical protein
VQARLHGIRLFSAFLHPSDRPSLVLTDRNEAAFWDDEVFPLSLFDHTHWYASSYWHFIKRN